jgi:glucosamine-6-phosphate deaminase
VRLVAEPPHHFFVNQLRVEIHANRAELGRAAARAAATCLNDAISRGGEARVIFGCAPSQDEFIAALVDPASGVDWGRVTVFHMDDYVGLPAAHAQSFRNYLQRHLLSRVAVGRFHPIPAEDPDSAMVCRRYEALLREKPIDLIGAGFGENGHIAFNDPPADFDDPAWVRIVEMDEKCRQQQVNDGCFPTLDAVPRRAITITVPVFRHARRVTAQVPGERKARAVAAALQAPIGPGCPASILRTHPNATLFLEPASAALLRPDVMS